jgi:hypothetical protein
MTKSTEAQRVAKDIEKSITHLLRKRKGEPLENILPLKSKITKSNILVNLKSLVKKS